MKTHREILFKGFCPNENGKQIITLDGEDIRGDWKEGFYANWEFDANDDGGYYPKPPYFVTEHFIITSLDGEYVCSGDIFKVIPESVCQYTGLKDKDGKRTWEGDIIEYKSGGVAEVIFSKYGAFVGKTEMLSHENIGGNLTKVAGDKFNTRRVE